MFLFSYVYSAAPTGQAVFLPPTPQPHKGAAARLCRSPQLCLQLSLLHPQAFALCFWQNHCLPFTPSLLRSTDSSQGISRFPSLRPAGEGPRGQTQGKRGQVVLSSPRSTLMDYTGPVPATAIRGRRRSVPPKPGTEKSPLQVGAWLKAEEGGSHGLLGSRQLPWTGPEAGFGAGFWHLFPETGT